MSETVLSPHTVNFHTERSVCKISRYLQKLPEVTILLQGDMVGKCGGAGAPGPLQTTAKRTTVGWFYTGFTGLLVGFHIRLQHSVLQLVVRCEPFMLSRSYLLLRIWWYVLLCLWRVCATVSSPKCNQEELYQHRNCTRWTQAQFLLSFFFFFAPEVWKTAATFGESCQCESSS